MKKLTTLTTLSLAVAMALAVVTARAAEECKGECPIAAAMKKLPQLVYKVGDETTCCSVTAAKLAKKANAEIQLVVADKTYKSEKDAKLALVVATENFVKSFAEPCVCKESGTITIAGKKVCCSVSAAQTAQLVKAAMDKVKVSYLVGDEACDCPIQAKALATKTGAKTLFVVGKEKTECSVTSRLNLARAKYRAAVEAIVAAEKKTEKKAS